MNLTQSQRILMSEIIGEWIKIAFDVSPVDKEKAEAAINLTYQVAEESYPQQIVWFDNPLEAVIWMLDNLDELNSSEYFSIVPYSMTKHDAK